MPAACLFSSINFQHKSRAASSKGDCLSKTNQRKASVAAPRKVAKGGGLPRGSATLTHEEFYTKIQQAIFEHRLPPGTQLVEERLVEISGMSRTKIRPVLARLAHEQLVTLIPNRGAFIASPTVDEAREVFFIRRVIEPAVSTLLCQMASPAHIRKLRQHAQKEHKARERGDRVAVIRLAGEFHVLLAELTSNAILVRLLRELTAQTCLVITLYDAPQIPACPQHHHDEIINAIEAKDQRSASALMIEHLNHVEQALRLEIEPKSVLELKFILD